MARPTTNASAETNTIPHNLWEEVGKKQVDVDDASGWLELSPKEGLSLKIPMANSNQKINYNYI